MEMSTPPTLLMGYGTLYPTSAPDLTLTSNLNPNPNSDQVTDDCNRIFVQCRLMLRPVGVRHMSNHLISSKSDVIYSMLISVCKRRILFVITRKHDVIHKTGSTRHIAMRPEEYRATATGIVKSYGNFEDLALI